VCCATLPPSHPLCRYDAKACACHWNGTACTHRCSFNSPHLGWRGPAVRVSGELVTKAPPSELSAPGSLTSAQIKELYDVLELGLQLLSGGGTSQGGANLASTCDATTGRDFVLGIISTDAGSSGFDKFWGTSCTLSSEGQTTTTNWKLLAQDRFMLTLLWWLGLTPNRIDICDAVTPDRCSFCEVSEERVERCKKNDDGTDSYASQKALIGECLGSLIPAHAGFVGIRRGPHIPRLYLQTCSRRWATSLCKGVTSASMAILHAKTRVFGPRSLMKFFMALMPRTYRRFCRCRPFFLFTCAIALRNLPAGAHLPWGAVAHKHVSEGT